jgi:enoyl-CoA hydratase/carnithine racemase
MTRNDTPASDLDAPVDYRIDADQTAWITLNRPHRHNAITSDLTAALTTGLRQAGTDQARVTVLQGAGRAFCAGHDLVEEPQSDAASRRWAQGLQDVTRAMRQLPCPVIAAVHGYVLGGGFEFALSADLVIAARTATFGFPEVGVGLSVTGGVTMLLPRLVGPLRAKQMLLLGEHLDATQAAGLGLVNWVSENDDLPARVKNLVKQLLDKPALSTKLAKRALDAGLENGLEPQLELEVGHLITASASPEAAAGRQAFRASKTR